MVVVSLEANKAAKRLTAVDVTPWGVFKDTWGHFQHLCWFSQEVRPSPIRGRRDQNWYFKPKP